MVEKRWQFNRSESKLIERILEDDHAGINHVVLGAEDALPEHYSNSHVYMIVVRGTISLQLDEQEPHSYEQGSILQIPFRTKMNVSNQQQEPLEFFIVKAPSPKKMTD
jgi:quercetin dioxygenase-like cupin family protein